MVSITAPPAVKSVIIKRSIEKQQSALSPTGSVDHTRI
jgi:hypothetical protein